MFLFALTYIPFVLAYEHRTFLVSSLYTLLLPHWISSSVSCDDRQRNLLLLLFTIVSPSDLRFRLASTAVSFHIYTYVCVRVNECVCKGFIHTCISIHIRFSHSLTNFCFLILLYIHLCRSYEMLLSIHNAIFRRFCTFHGSCYYNQIQNDMHDKRNRRNISMICRCFFGSVSI